MYRNAITGVECSPYAFRPQQYAALDCDVGSPAHPAEERRTACRQHAQRDHPSAQVARCWMHVRATCLVVPFIRPLPACGRAAVLRARNTAGVVAGHFCWARLLHAGIIDSCPECLAMRAPAVVSPIVFALSLAHCADAGPTAPSGPYRLTVLQAFGTSSSPYYNGLTYQSYAYDIDPA